MKTAMLFLLALGLNACAATAPTRVEVETPGTLAPSYASIATAPIHAGTDLSGGFAAVDSDDAPVAAAVGGEDVTPDVSAKGGLTMGSVR